MRDQNPVHLIGYQPIKLLLIKANRVIFIWLLFDQFSMNSLQTKLERIIDTWRVPLNDWTTFQMFMENATYNQWLRIHLMMPGWLLSSLRCKMGIYDTIQKSFGLTWSEENYGSCACKEDVRKMEGRRIEGVSKAKGRRNEDQKIQKNAANKVCMGKR